MEFAPALDRYRADLDRLADQSRIRTLAANAGIDFTSNDYLGLAASKRVASIPLLSSFRATRT